jgi:hypothetical protein
MTSRENIAPASYSNYGACSHNPPLMKTLKFYRPLARMILADEKTTTWRLFDDKDLSADDTIACVLTETREEFATIRIISVRETTLGELSDDDWDGHERFADESELYATYSGYYGRPVNARSPVKILKFAVIDKKLF